ncbi:MAG: ATP-binding protein [Roseateles sp.]|uniref:ATP-binding protein n=1 Tax=Roseateles sp. TaxID=1971397 RepID=UPI0040369322
MASRPTPGDPGGEGGEGAWPGDGDPTLRLRDEGPMRAVVLAALTAGEMAAWHSDLVTRERWWSAQMFVLHGLSGDAPVPADYMDLVLPEDRPVVERAFSESITQGSHRVQYRVVWPDGSVHWLEGRGQAHRRHGQPAEISGVCQLIDNRKREEADLAFLAAASLEFARSIDYEDTLRRIAAMAVPHFADWCAVDMLDDEGMLRRVAVAHVEAAKVALAQQLHQTYPPAQDGASGVWQVLRSGQAELVAQITEDMLVQGAADAAHLDILRQLGLRSYMGVPITMQQGVAGVLTFVSAESGRIYGRRDLDIAADLASRAAVAISNAKLFQELQRSQRRQEFLLRLTDVLRTNGSTAQVLQQVSEMVGLHFGVNRVGYGHVDEHLDRIDFDICWTDGSVPALGGRFPASAFGPQVIARLRAGHTVVIGNVRQHPLTSEPTTVETSHEVDTRAILVVPLFKAGRLRTIVYLNQRMERDWASDDVALMEEVAERTRELIERGRTEEALRSSEARWRGLFERMNEGFFVAEAIRDDAGEMVDFWFLQANPAFEKLTGVATSAAIGRTVREVIPGVPQAIIDTYARALADQAPQEFEVHVPALGDRWYEARLMRLGAEQFSVLFVEITDRKRAQQALEQSASRYRTLFESIDEGFCLIDVLFDAAGRPVDYRFAEVNPAFERQSGLVAAQGRTVRELVPDIETAYIDTYAGVALTGESLRFESHSDSLQRWFDTFAFRVGEPHDRRVGLLFTDITARKRVEEALRLADVRKNEFLATLAHELRNPLAPLRNGLMILRNANAADAAAVRARELMDRQLSHLVRLVDDLLDVSRVSQGKVTMRKSATSLQAVVETALETARPVIDAAGHRLSVELPAQTVPLDVDPTRIAQVLSNLLNNAAKYTPTGGRIQLRAAVCEGPSLRIEVEDNGLGIPAHMMEDIFELFTQVGSALERSQGGLGIGLSLARRLVELHGGSIHARSPGAEGGSIFVVELPLPPNLDLQQGSGGAASDADGAPGRQRRILVVDDNVDAAESLQMLLALGGHEVHIAHTGATALAAVAKHAPDLVFLDIGLPDMTGYAVAQGIRAQPLGAGVVLVALTGWGSAHDQQRARAAGVDLHLTKPVAAKDLAHALGLQHAASNSARLDAGL